MYQLSFICPKSNLPQPKNQNSKLGCCNDTRLNVKIKFTYCTGLQISASLYTQCDFFYPSLPHRRDFIQVIWNTMHVAISS